VAAPTVAVVARVAAAHTAVMGGLDATAEFPVAGRSGFRPTQIA